MNVSKKYIWFCIVLLVAYASSIGGYLYSSPIELVSFTAISATVFVIIAEIYSRKFDYPLFFVRDEPSIWGGLFGGFTTIVSYYIGFRIGFFFDLTIVDIYLASICFFCLFASSITLYTGSIIQDLKRQ